MQADREGRARLLRRILCIAAATLVFAGMTAATAAAEEEGPPPRLAGVGSAGSTNLDIGTYWGLEPTPHVPAGSTAIVGAPFSIQVSLWDDSGDSLFVLIQQRLAKGPACGATPAATEDVVQALTPPSGTPVTQGAEYDSNLIWTPTEPGDYGLCAFLSRTPSSGVAAMNPGSLTVEPAPGRLTLGSSVTPGRPASITVTVSGEAPVASVLHAALQPAGLSCTRPDGGLSGQLLAPGPGSPQPLPSGPFTIAYPFAVAPGAYEVCAYLKPAPTSERLFWLPYEVGSTPFVVPEPPPEVKVEPPPGPPALSALAITSHRFRVASKHRHRGGGPYGTTFRFRLGAAATVKISIVRLEPGVRRGARCAPGSHGHHCTRRVTIGTFERSLAAGTDSITFTGVLDGRRLPAGSYEASVVASGPGGSSPSLSVGFSVR